MASPPNAAPVPCVPVARAPAIVCRSMSPRLVSDQPRRTSSPLSRCSGTPAATVTSPSSAHLDRPGEAGAGQLDVLGAADAGEGVPAADRSHPAAGRGGGRQDLGDLGGRTGLHDLGGGALVPGPVAPARAAAGQCRGLRHAHLLRRSSALPWPRGWHSAAPASAGQRPERVDPPMATTGTLRRDEPARCRRRGRALPGPAGRRDRRPRPAAGRPRPGRAGRQRRRPGPAGVREADPGRQQVGPQPRGAAPGAGPPGFCRACSPTRCPRPCG